ncbi:YqjF family protein [Daejeonella sp.]|uniref:YqjF family protein n=1 Tax=Daejeonella sp. TaxID=2805397 RepID=UPI0027B9C636|nr:DUF2071 domain-containing protein [Daejeonella sp.]
MNFLEAKWENLIMANYAVDPTILIPYLPKGVELDSFEGKCYVSLVGFMFNKTKIFNVPIPYLGSFEEINLRFYVVRKDGDTLKRGVVFINETVPYAAVAWMANYLYKEHYTAVKTKHDWELTETSKKINYSWKKNKKWNTIQVNAQSKSNSMKNGSVEAFIFEHYFGYTRVNENKTLEYGINHPSWKINQVIDYRIDCDFEQMYGYDFAFLNAQQPDNVILAEGSDVSVKWKRNAI